jgi:hypothetical protein
LYILDAVGCIVTFRLGDVGCHDLGICSLFTSTTLGLITLYSTVASFICHALGKLTIAEVVSLYQLYIENGTTHHTARPSGMRYHHDSVPVYKT